MATDFVRDRAAMEKHIQGGGSVLLPDGRNVTRVEDLPAEAALAEADVARHQANVERLTAEHKAKGEELTAAKEALAKAEKTAGAAEKAEAKATHPHGHAKKD